MNHMIITKPILYLFKFAAAIDWHDHLEFPDRKFLEIVERIVGYEDEPLAAIFVPPTESFWVTFCYCFVPSIIISVAVWIENA